MITVRKAHERGHANHGWLDTYHTFSFADYQDPEHTNFGTLRVLNEDRVAPGAGFGTHQHRDMEIITYVLEGALEHKDSMGSVGVIRPGDVQRMSAGSGILHSEYNASKTDKVHFLQVWIFPQTKNLTPSYEQKHFDEADGWQLLVTDGPANGELKIHQDAKLYRAIMKDGQMLPYALRNRRRVYLQVARGLVGVNGTELRGGDGVAVEQENQLTVKANSEAEVLLFDLA